MEMIKETLTSNLKRTEYYNNSICSVCRDDILKPKENNTCISLWKFQTMLMLMVNQSLAE